jgi:serine phosphatase RsbU (regulator of sigma subunit)
LSPPTANERSTRTTSRSQTSRCAAAAVKNARLYHEQARVARHAQASLLPERPPEHPDWDAAAAYQAGERGADVGGDYDIARRAGGGQLVFLGDVTGRASRRRP